MVARLACLALAALSSVRFTLAAQRSGGGGSALEITTAGSRQQMQLSANPIRKVVTLLQNMAKQVEKEGEEEKKLYEKFTCFCKHGSADLQQSIAESSTKVPAVQSDIETAESVAARLKADLKQHKVDRDAAKAAMQDATGLREKEHQSYTTEAEGLKSFVSALASAIPAIEAGMSGGTGLMQLGAKIAATLRRAATANSAITDYDRQSVLSFLGGSSTDASSSGYVPKGGEILGILREMKASFDKELAAVEQKESESVKTHEELIAAKTKEVKALSASIEKKTARVGQLEVDVVQMKNDLSSTEKALIEDQKFLKDLDKDCDGKAKEYEERSKLRSEELVAIRETIGLLNSDDALELFKKTLPSASFVQLRTAGEQSKERAMRSLRAAIAASKRLDGPSARFVALVLDSGKVDFSKVIKMIDDMIALLVQEQSDDEQKQEYCNRQIDATKDKAKELSITAQDIEKSIEERKEMIVQLTEEIKQLKKRVAELDKSVTEATAQRKEENTEFTELMSSNSAAKELLQMAKTRLHKFYAPKLALVSVRQQTERRRDEPSPAPATWQGSYAKKTEGGMGVLAMIDRLVQDLDHEITEAEKQEEISQKAYEDFMSDSAAKRTKDMKSIAIKDESKATSEDLATTEKGDLAGTKKEFMATEKYLTQLHAECDWLLQNFDLRKTARSEESENLKNAKAVLSGADFSLLQSKAVRGLKL